MKHRVTLIPGDGIGPEVTKPTLQIIKAAGVNIDWDSHLAGAEALKKYGTTMPTALMDSFEKNRVALKGPVTTPVGEGFSSVNVALRQTFNLYANLRPIKNLPGVKARYQGIDLIVVRENTEGLYSGIEHDLVERTVEIFELRRDVAVQMTDIKMTADRRLHVSGRHFATAHGRLCILRNQSQERQAISLSNDYGRWMGRARPRGWRKRDGIDVSGGCAECTGGAAGIVLPGADRASAIT